MAVLWWRVSWTHTKRWRACLQQYWEMKEGCIAQLCMSRLCKWVVKGLWFLSRTFPSLILSLSHSLSHHSVPHITSAPAKGLSKQLLVWWGGLIGADSTAVQEHMDHSHKRAELGCKGSFEPILSEFTHWAGLCNGNPTCPHANYQPCG